MSMIKYYDLGYSEVFICDEFLINQIREGITVTTEHNDKLVEIIDLHFRGKPVVYISNRFFSYSVDPITYIHTSKIHNLLAMAIVAANVEKRVSAEFERKFYSKPFKVFENLSDAIQWAKSIIVNHSD